MSFKSQALPSVQAAMTASQPSALTTGDLRAVIDALCDIAPSWTAELQGACVDETSLIVMPEDAEDLLGPSFVLTRETCGYRVGQVHWDTLTELGAFSSFGDAVSIIRQRVSQWLPTGSPVSTTRH